LREAKNNVRGLLAACMWRATRSESLPSVAFRTLPARRLLSFSLALLLDRSFTQIPSLPSLSSFPTHPVDACAFPSAAFQAIPHGAHCCSTPLQQLTSSVVAPSSFLPRSLASPLTHPAAIARPSRAPGPPHARPTERPARCGGSLAHLTPHPPPADALKPSPCPALSYSPSLPLHFFLSLSPSLPPSSPSPSLPPSPCARPAWGRMDHDGGRAPGPPGPGGVTSHGRREDGHRNVLCVLTLNNWFACKQCEQKVVRNQAGKGVK
jgi:hypothetical protein